MLQIKVNTILDTKVIYMIEENVMKSDNMDFVTRVQTDQME